MIDAASGTIDLEALKLRYAEERDKRLRIAGRGDYTAVRGTALADRFDLDVWATGDRRRQPGTGHARV